MHSVLNTSCFTAVHNTREWHPLSKYGSTKTDFRTPEQTASIEEGSA